MRYAMLLVMMMCAACGAEELPPLDATGAAGSVGVSEQALLPSCTNASYCSKLKSFATQFVLGGGSWTWAGACSSSATWYGQGPGGRTVTATPFNGITSRYFDQSQGLDSNVYCSCVGTNNVSCHF